MNLIKRINSWLPVRIQNNSGFVGTAIAVVTAVVNTVVAAAGVIGGAMGAVASAAGGVVGAIGQAAGALASGMGIGSAGALTQGGAMISGAVQGGIWGSLGGAALAGATGKPVGKGALSGALMGAGIGGGGAFAGAGKLGSGAIIGGAVGGATGGAVTAPEGQKVLGALKGGATGYLAGGGVDKFQAGRAATVDAASAAGESAPTFGQQVWGGFKNLAGDKGTIGTSASNFTLDNIMNKGANTGLAQLGAAGVAGSVMKEPEMDFRAQGESFMKDYETTKTYLGDTNLPESTRNEIDYFINTPLDQISAERFGYNTESTKRLINEKFDAEIAQTKKDFAQRGHTIAGSSDYQRKEEEIQNNRINTLANIEQESNNRVQQMAIERKQWAFGEELNQNVYNGELAQELARLMNRDKELQYAIDTENYEDFQSIIADIMMMGRTGSQG